MTAGEQLVWKLKKEAWEAGEKQGWEAGNKQGWEAGNKQGWEAGMNDEKQRIAKSMKNNHLDINLIAQCTNLTPEQIEKL